MAVQAGPLSLGFFLGIAGAQGLGTPVHLTEEAAAQAGTSASSYSPGASSKERELLCPLARGPRNPLATGVPPARPVALRSPSGLITYPYECADLAAFARDILENEAGIPNRRVVVDTQHWESKAGFDEDELRCIAEEFQTTICIKTNAAPYVVEIEPHFERVRQQGLGELAAKGKKKRVEKVSVEHSITLETLKETQKIGSWGADRIVLDGIQNHLPSDSGGTKVSITLKIGNKWHSLKGGLSLASKGKKVKAVAFSDDGRSGFSYHKLGIDYSDKPNGSSVGQFGRGLKQATAAALAMGMEMEILSQNWRAVPEWHEMVVDNKIVNRLRFDVEVKRGVRMRRGSKTIFYDPSQAFIEALSDVEQKVLHFRPGYEPLYTDGAGNAIVDDSGHVFVKGVFITSDYKDRLLFGYDLNTEEIPSDRNQIRERVIGSLIGGLIAKSDDRDLISTYLRNSLRRIDEDADQKLPAEADYIPLRWTGRGNMWRRPAYPELWKEAFYELFGDHAVLWTSEAASTMARLANCDVIRCKSNNFRHFLANICGIPLDSSVGQATDAFLLGDIEDASGANPHSFETSFSLSYRAKKWKAMRLLLDALTNHMPADSGGTKVKVELKVPAQPKGNVYRWVDWSAGSLPENIEEIRIVDDGRGYHFSSLRYAFSDKPAQAVGQFGEGLKMVSAAALRMEGVRIKFRSGNWVATPFASAPKKLGSGDQQILCFRVLEGVDPIDGSITTIRGVDSDLLRALGRLDDYVLPLRDEQKYLHSSAKARMFLESYMRFSPNGTVYNKGVFITDHYASRLLFSYDLDTDNISPDRDDVDIETLEDAVKDSVVSLTDRKAIQKILMAARDEPGRDRMEFIDTELDEEVAAVWKGVFYELFGANAVIATSPDAALEALHQGFLPISLNGKVAFTLHEAGVEYDMEVTSEGLIMDEVPYDELTPEERAMIEGFKDVDEVLGLPHFQNIKIFSKARSRIGRELNTLGGYWDGRTIYIARRILETFASASRIYVHERGHKETKARDVTDAFRRFFEYYLNALIGKEIERKRQDPSYRVGVEGFSRADLGLVEELKKMIGVLKAQLEAEKRRADEAEERLAEAIEGKKSEGE